jgi:release factor glutamine methyltransferase
MTIKEILQQASRQLQKTSSTPALDAEVLLAYVLKKDRAFLFAHFDKTLSSRQHERYKKLIARREKREPVAYVRRTKEFFGLDFYVDKRALIPRPETETLVEFVLESITKKKWTNSKLKICDVGTGSGCIAVTLAKKLPLTKIYATDISKKALAVAKINAKKHKVQKQIKFFNGDLLKPIPPNVKFDIIAANLPYLTIDQLKMTEEEIQLHEPKIALLAGKEESALYTRLLQQIPKYIKKDSLVFLEIDPKFKDKFVKEIIKKFKIPKSKIRIKKDLSNLDRIIRLDY